MKGLHRDLLYTFTYSVPRESSYKFIILLLVHDFQLALLGTHCENRLENKMHSVVNAWSSSPHPGLEGKYLHGMSPTGYPAATGLRDLILNRLFLGSKPEQNYSFIVFCTLFKILCIC